jgi:hypothetical protein
MQQQELPELHRRLKGVMFDRCGKGSHISNARAGEDGAMLMTGSETLPGVPSFA